METTDILAHSVKTDRKYLDCIVVNRKYNRKRLCASLLQDRKRYTPNSKRILIPP